MRRWVSLVAAMCCATALFYVYTIHRNTFAIPDEAPPFNQTTLLVGGQTIHVSIADTKQAREEGLSGHTRLAADEGMLFVFETDGTYAFWMKDMRFSIDILWLSAEGRVVYMAENIAPDTYPQTFKSETPARYVIELPAGYSDDHGVRVGDIVRL